MAWVVEAMQEAGAGNPLRVVSKLNRTAAKQARAPVVVSYSISMVMLEQ